MAEPVWMQTTADGFYLRLKVVPNASRSALDGTHGDALKIRLAAPPVDGKANAALIEFLAERLAISRSGVAITAGDGGRWKRVRVTGLASADALARLQTPA